MIDLLKMRLRQGQKTAAFPPVSATMPERYRGRPVIDAGHCPSGCRKCADRCPTDAISIDSRVVDLGKCLFCTECRDACPEHALAYSRDYRLATSTREALVVGESGVELASALDRQMRRLFGRSLKLRQVSAGGCNGCETELVALDNIIFDLGRFGIQFVASPRHADGIVITGPVTRNMEAALRDTYAAMPEPRIVIAIGACAISGGLHADAPECGRGVPDDIRVDLYVPGCPPHPLTVIDGLLRLLGRIEDRA